VRTRFEPLAVGEHGAQKVRLAGRLQPLRRMGKKILFADIADQSGRIQLYFRQESLADGFATVDLLDRGDIIGVAGAPFRTKTGELSIAVEQLHVLSKALRPLPEKWHGLTDPETHKEVPLPDAQFVIAGGPGLETGDTVRIEEEEPEGKQP